MTYRVIVFDAGAVDQITTNREFRTVLRELLSAGFTPMIPTVVLAEVITGRPADAAANRAVNEIGTVDTTPATARLAGNLRYIVGQSGARRVPGAIDAIVAAHAIEGGSGIVFTTDPGDMKRLLGSTPSIVVERP